MHKGQQSCFSSKRKLTSRKRKSISADWATLPQELLDAILEKLVRHSDYVRFGAVCKSWHSVAIDQKQRRIETIYTPPPTLLLTGPEDNYTDKNGFFELRLSQLYSITKDEFYQNNHVLGAPREVVCLGCSYGWLAIGNSLVAFQEEGKEDSFPITVLEEYEDDDDDDDFFLITLFNPSTQRIIAKPAIFSGKIRKIILSCDPTTCPGDFALAALLDNCPSQVAFMKTDENKWTFAHSKEKYLFSDIKDIIFHNGLLYALDHCNRLITIDYRQCIDDDQNTQAIVTIPPGKDAQAEARFTMVPGIHTPEPPWSYLLEASNGDLLLVERYLSNSPRYEYLKIPGTLKVYKREEKKTALSYGKEEVVEWAEINELGNDDTIFLGDNTSLCIPAASCYPNCKRNSIYFAHNFKNGRYHVKYLAVDCDFGVFDIGSRKLGELHSLGDSQDRISPVAWVSSVSPLY